MKKLLLFSILLFSLVAAPLPVLAEEVKVLLDVPAPYAENVFWFPGGRYLLLVNRDWSGNYRRFVVYDVDKKRWRSVTGEAKSRDELGEGPYVCVTAYCPFLVSVSGHYLKASVEEPECRLDAKIYTKQIGWRGWGIAADPIEHHVAASGRYVLYKVRSLPEDPDSTGVAADVAILQVPENPDVWRSVIYQYPLSSDPLETFPVLWRSEHARPVTTASWLHPLLGNRDRLVLITTDRDDAWNKATYRLIVLEVVL